MERWPDFFIAGAPKAGTTALHAALVGHPQLALSVPKEPKYFLCDGSPPDRAHHQGPGDAHSRQEWVWRKDRYLALWDGAPDDVLRGESTPFYLYDHAAHERIAAVAPRAKLVVMLRDPVDRAYSNWMHLWSDGLEPQRDFLRAVEAEEERRAAGWAPFWRYRALGRYGEQLRHLYQHVDPSQVLVLRYRRLVDEPERTVATVLDFLGIDPRLPREVAADNHRSFRPDTPRTRAVAKAVRLGATAGSYAPPQVWRTVSRPFLAELQRGGVVRPELTPAQRRLVLEPMLDDIALLEQLTGESFEDWRQPVGNGSYASRAQSTSSVTRSWAPSGRASS